MADSTIVTLLSSRIRASAHRRQIPMLALSSGVMSGFGMVGLGEPSRTLVMVRLPD